MLCFETYRETTVRHHDDTQSNICHHAQMAIMLSTGTLRMETLTRCKSRDCRWRKEVAVYSVESLPVEESDSMPSE